LSETGQFPAGHTYHAEYQGWKGAGYYYFPAYGNKRTGYVKTPYELNQAAIRITGHSAANIQSLLHSGSSGNSGSTSSGSSSSGSNSVGPTGSSYGSHSNPYSAWVGYQGAGWYRWVKYGKTAQVSNSGQFNNINNALK